MKRTADQTNTPLAGITKELLTAEAMTRLRERAIAWFAANARPLPWRTSYAPYHVWLSEIMLQQTQMERGVIYFERWLQRFPTIAHIAEATEEEVLQYWEGLGYYSRARNLHKAATIMVEKHHGQVPAHGEALLALAGIGRYTAGAIMSIAFQEDFPLVDGNVERLFARLFSIDLPSKSPGGKKLIWEIASRLLPPGQARAWNQALMELGALICRPSSPSCNLCPLAASCHSHSQGTTELFPVPGATTRTIAMAFVAAVIIRDGLIYVQKRPARGLWANLWEFPGGHLEKDETPEEGALREVMEETEMAIRITAPLPLVTHSFTKYRATVHAFLCKPVGPTPAPQLHAAQEYRWLPLRQLDDLAFSAGHRKIISILREPPALLRETV